MNQTFRRFSTQLQRHIRTSLTTSAYPRPTSITAINRRNFHAQVAVNSAPPPKAKTGTYLDYASKPDIDFDRLQYSFTCPDFKDSVWGFVIYRCAGGNDAAWNHILQAVQDVVQQELKYNIREDLLQHHDLRVVDNSSLYGATIDDVRQHFQGWVKEDIQARLRPESTELTWSGAASTPRYQCCLYVDDLCLESVDHQGAWCSPVVKLVCRDWEPYTLEERQMPVPSPWHDGVTEYNEEDVGWMYMPLSYYLDRYETLDEYSWDDVYVRPPYIEGNETEEDFMGHWRRQKTLQ